MRLKNKPIITRVGDAYRSMTAPNPFAEFVRDKINQIAVNSGSEFARNAASAVTGISRLPGAFNNRVNAAITRAIPLWTGEQVENPRNMWTIDKSNHLARYYDSKGKQAIVSVAGTGLATGNKSVEGDNRTPDGTYTLSYPEKGASKKGGELSFGPYFYRTNHRNKGGGASGVGLHGSGNPLFNGMNISHGCIRLDNDAVRKFHSIAPNSGGGAKITIYEKRGGRLSRKIGLLKG